MLSATVFLASSSSIFADTTTPPTLSVSGGHGQIFTIAIPAGATQVVFIGAYHNYDNASIDMAQGTPSNYINPMSWPRSCTYCQMTLTYTIDQSSSLHQLSYRLNDDN